MEEKKAHFFTHRECEYFPCHKTHSPEDFNCLFCYCPLYMMGSKCGGNFFYTGKGIKNCKNCDIPHRKSSYEYIASKFSEIAKVADE